jgi:hypothetical protein
MKVRVSEPHRCYHVGVRPMHTGIGMVWYHTDTLDSGRGELHVEERVKIAKVLGYTTHT